VGGMQSVSGRAIATTHSGVKTPHPVLCPFYHSNPRTLGWGTVRRWWGKNWGWNRTEGPSTFVPSIQQYL
jgi:hypothetical protein